MAEQFSEADELFGRRPEEFTAARNALAKRLRADGNGDEAARVAALRRPSQTAWALNQLARSRPDLVEALIGAGDRLRGATEQAMGGDRSGFQTAQADERQAMQEAVSAAARLLAEAGLRDSDSARQRVTETLRAATVDADVAGRVRRGVLETDASASGFGLSAFALLPESGAKPSITAADETTTVDREHADRVADLERDLLKATTRLEGLLAEADEAGARMSQLRRQAVEARREVGLAQKSLDQERKRRKK